MYGTWSAWAMDTMPSRTPFLTNVTDQAWVFIAPYLTVMTSDAPQRRHDLREVAHALRWMVRASAPRL